MVEFNIVDRTGREMVIPEGAAVDDDLSWPARGLINYLYTLPPGKKPTLDELAVLGHWTLQGVRVLLHELREHGYIDAEGGKAQVRTIFLLPPPQRGGEDETVS